MTIGKWFGIIPFAIADVAHLVERHLAKVEVASSSLVIRSRKSTPEGVLFSTKFALRVNEEISMKEGAMVMKGLFNKILKILRNIIYKYKWEIAAGFNRYQSFIRERYYKIKRKKLKNMTPTIIASDCFGTFVSHNLGLQFRSPTVNLYIEKEDFIKFINNLSAFLNAEPEEYYNNEFSYPVGLLEADGQRILIHFMHYSSFDIAKEKWNERKQRVSFDNMYIIQLIEEATEEDIAKFEKLPFEKKMLVTRKNPTKSKYIVTHNVFNKKSYYHSKILEYPSALSFRRYMDKIDYVSFLNS